MDHLPGPIDGPMLFVRVYAVREVYEPGLFFSLPGEARLDFGSLVAKGFPDNCEHPRHNKEFLQEWLYFALLAQCLGRDISLLDFKDRSGYLTTSNLGQLLKKWATTQQTGTKPGLDAAKRMSRYRARLALGEARRYVENHCSMALCEKVGDCPSPHHPRSRDNTAIGLEDSDDLGVLYLSFAILGETLQRTGVLYEDPEKPSNDIIFDDKTWRYNAHASRTLLENKLCRAEVRRLEFTFSGVLATYCASTIKRGDHEMRPSDLVNHAGCTATRCIAQNTGKDSNPMHFYRLCHDSVSSHCDKVHFDAALLDNIIGRNQVPLFTWERNKLYVKGYDLEKSNMIFGALSHRWKDNIFVSRDDSNTPGVNLAYACQLRALQEAFDQIVSGHSFNEHVPFWVDFLCIKQTSADSMSWSLSQIRHIFKKATTVLVWDRGLLVTHKKDYQEDIALNMRVGLSSWAQRMWTLLETVVSNDFAIAFDDGFISLNQLKMARDRAKQDDGDKYHYVWRLGQPFSPAIEELRLSLTSPASPRASPPRYHHIACLWRAVQFRLVSDQRDETIILANVLDLDAVHLLKITEGSADQIESERMIEFLDMLDSTPRLGIPPGIIFLPGPPLRDVKVTDRKGYGWAPRSWLSKRPEHEANPLIENSFDSFIGKHGLFVTYPGMLLHCSGDYNSLLKEFSVPLDENLLQRYHVTMEPVEASVSEPDDDAKSTAGNSPHSLPDGPKPEVDRSSKPQLGLILSTTKFNKIGEKEKLGLLVKSKGKLGRGRGKTLWVSKIGRVWVRLETNREAINECVRMMREREHDVFVGEPLPEEQLWCVDGDDGDASQ